MSIKELTCINCPLGCHLSVELDKDQAIVSVSGNGCVRGEHYAKNEIQNPKRVVCSTVLLEGGVSPLISVKTAEAVPKAKIFEVMQKIRSAKAQAPLEIGDVIISDIAHTGVDLLATSKGLKKERG